MTKASFIEWVRRQLPPRLQGHDVVLLDNVAAHKTVAVRFFIEERGATALDLPPHSHDFNPLETECPRDEAHRSGAPLSALALRRVAHAARYAVTPRHCRQYLSMPGTSTQVRTRINATWSSRSSFRPIFVFMQRIYLPDDAVASIASYLGHIVLAEMSEDGSMRVRSVPLGALDF